LNIQGLTPAITVVITSFGFGNIIPSVRSYLNDDVKKCRIAILLGSLIPLACYLLWIGVIFAEIPLSGVDGLLAMLTSSEPTSHLIRSINMYTQSAWVNTWVHVFTSISVTTSFLGVALSLSDFLADGFKISKQGKNEIIIYGLTFLPPLILVLFYPKAFIACLNYAGIICVILLVMLPIAMVWQGRYKKNIANHRYQVSGGKIALLVTFILGILIILQDIIALARG
jgi:tyrosine-specific transport protein